MRVTAGCSTAYVLQRGTYGSMFPTTVKILNTKDMQPFRRNAPIDVFGDYGKLEACVLVALNGEFQRLGECTSHELTSLRSSR